jgi:hypothetical protein
MSETLHVNSPSLAQTKQPRIKKLCIKQCCISKTYKVSNFNNFSTKHILLVIVIFIKDGGSNLNRNHFNEGQINCKLCQSDS